MMLRASVQSSGGEVDLRAVTGEVVESGVSHGELLVDFAEAAVRREERLGRVRQALVDVLGGEALVDAAGTVGNFQRMVRIADGTGIPIDEAMAAATGDFRESLGLERFGSAANSRSPQPRA